MPWFAALEAGVFLALRARHAALAHTTRSADEAVAVGRGAPLQAAVFTHKDILIDGLELLEVLR